MRLKKVFTCVLVMLLVIVNSSIVILASNVTKVTQALTIEEVKKAEKNLKGEKDSIDLLTKETVVKTKSKNDTGYVIFSEKQINKRIETIRDYYYNKPNKLKIRKQKICSFSDYKDICNMEYYIHGKDLMFAYGVDGNTEYRLYFYKNQLIQLLVDKPGQSRKVYKQLYKRLESNEFSLYNNDLNMYLLLEGYARKEMEYAYSETNKILSERYVLITRVSGNKIVYHKLNCYGPDGWIWSVDPKVYTAKVNKDISIEDDSDISNTTYRDLKWLKESVAEPYFGMVAILSEKGKKVSKILIPYFA